MALIPKTLFPENLDRYNVFVQDTEPNSRYFNITELPDTFTGGKNAFLIAGASELVADTLIKIEIKDAAGNIIYHEPGEGSMITTINGDQFTSEYYEGVSKVVSVYVYPGDTAYGPCTITILGELSSYYDNNGLVSPIPLNWEGQYNVKWQKTINVNPTLANTTKIRFYRRPSVSINELISPVYRIENGLKINTGINQSFASIKLSNLETFAGDVKRVKVFRTSLGDISDYDMIQDILVESKELLTSYGLTGSVVGNTGILTSETLKEYWNTGSLTTTLDSTRVEAGVKLKGAGNFTYSASLDLKSTNTYEINFDAFYSSSTNSNLGIYLNQITTSTDGITPLVISSSIGTLIGTQPTKNLLDTTIPFKIDRNYPSASLYFSQSQGEWDLGNISLRLSEDTAFSPDEISFVTTMPTVVGNEDYNFKFEFYDVNNNYVPVIVTGSANFTGGSNAITKLLTFESDRTAFRFSTGSYANPPNQNVRFKTIKTNFTGSITYASSAFDVGGTYIEPTSYAGTYPGWFTSQNDNGALLSIASFSGSVSTVLVGSIVYTASCEGFEEYETIYRFEDGDNAPGVFVTSNTNQFIYKATDLSLNPTGQVITIEAKRKNLASATTPLTVNSGSGTPPLTFVSTNATNGVDTYTLAGTAYPYDKGERNYFISGSDQFGNEFSDTIKISPVKILDGFSVATSNENTSFSANSVGSVIGGFASSSGSITVKVGNEVINYASPIVNNTFSASISSTSALTANTFNGINYSINSLTADSGSLTLLVKYQDGGGTIISSSKEITYSKVKKAAPVLSFVVGNNNQTVTAKSTGEQIDSFVTANLSVIETYDGISSTKTLTAAPTTTATNSYTIGSKTATTIALPNMANGTDSVDIAITGSVVDSESTTRLVYGNISLAKSKKAVPSVRISATPQSQTVAANAAGIQTGTLANVTITALEGAISRFTSMVISGTPVGFSTAPTVSGATLTMTSAVMNADEASVTLIVTHTDSEGTTGQTQTIIIRASKIKQGESGVVVNLNPASQVVTVSNTGTYGTPTSFVVSVVEGAVSYTYDGTSPYAVSTFRISDLTGGTNSNGTITPTTPTTLAGTTVSFNVIYVNAAGTSATIPQSHKVSVTLDGQTGPGVVFTGVWAASRAYQFSTGAGTGRRDVVLWSTDGNAPYKVYYAAKRQHTSATGDVVDGAPHRAAQTGWESLGTQDFFVAAKIGLFEDSFVQNNLNIGTNSNGGVSTANITLSGGTQYPYFSLGQNPIGVYNADGIFIGAVNDGGTKYRMSLKSAGNALTWDGSTLTVQGTLKVADGTGVASSTDLSTGLGTKLGAGQAAADVNNNTTTISGGKIRTGLIQSNNFGGTGDGSAFATDGMSIDLTGGGISAKNFRITAAGSAFFRGDISGASGTFTGALSGATITGGTIRIGSGTSVFSADSSGIYLGNETFGSAPFRVTPGGALTASGVNISGTLTATGGTFGGWIIDGNQLKSKELPTQDRILLDGGANAITMTVSGLTRFNLNTNSSLPEPNITGGGSISIGGTSELRQGVGSVQYDSNTFTAANSVITNFEINFTNTSFAVEYAGGGTSTLNAYYRIRNTTTGTIQASVLMGSAIAVGGDNSYTYGSISGGGLYQALSNLANANTTLEVQVTAGHSYRAELYFEYSTPEEGTPPAGDSSYVKLEWSTVTINVAVQVATVVINGGGFLSAVNAGKYLRMSNVTTDAVNIEGGIKWDRVDGRPGYVARAWCVATWSNRTNNYASATVQASSNVLAVGRNNTGWHNITFVNALPKANIGGYGEIDTRAAVFASGLRRYSGTGASTGEYQVDIACNPIFGGGSSVMVYTYDNDRNAPENVNLLNVVVFA